MDVCVHFAFDVVKRILRVVVKKHRSHLYVKGSYLFMSAFQKMRLACNLAIKEGKISDEQKET